MGVTPSTPSAGIKLLAFFLGVVVVPILAIAVLEGGSSLVLLSLALWRGEQSRMMQGGRHARYDAELGWANVPNRSLPDEFGPKVGVQIDPRGFRVTQTSGAGFLRPKLRVICSGDSFTFGFGVADDRTWCALLSAVDSGLATVNMGQAGYGVDQAYLWYKRDGIRLEHEIHLFTYITNDLLRMKARSVFGFAKPVLVIRKDSLAVENIPVPRSDASARGYRTAVLVRNELRLAQLMLWVRDSIFHGHGAHQGSLSAEWSDEDSLTWLKVRRLTADLARINRMKGSTLILVHLPVVEDYWTTRPDPWRERAKAAAGDGEFVFVDLVRELRQLPADSMEQMFIGHHVPGYADGFGHYSVAGNEWVAKQIYRRLLEMPAVAAKLGRSPGSTQAPGRDSGLAQGVVRAFPSDTLRHIPSRQPE